MNVSCFCVLIDSIDLYKVEDLYKVRRCKFVSLANVSCFCLSIDTIALYKAEVCQPCKCVLFLCIYRYFRSIQGRSLSALQMCLVSVYL